MRGYCARAVTLVSASVSLGFAIEAFVDRSDGVTAEGYALARSAALVLAVTVALWLRSRTALLVAATAMIVVQGLDGFVGLADGNIVLAVGPWFTAVLNVVVTVPLLRRR
ncbi:hypothetical protein F1D05_29725 [Kribbella qitaiheensis]|uniref:Uncharacterized protein n=1 Tax=Kribbella qitaiheensis TaxID=1544730 RepID=A0A7G6X519_9ACTN|nr:hypothetical protein [Kribbella qitaiheensis]QNE21334.1 hypothetical protein F1D05_29725 [Kribbella qitaiheensis]